MLPTRNREKLPNGGEPCRAMRAAFLIATLLQCLRAIVVHPDEIDPGRNDSPRVLDAQGVDIDDGGVTRDLMHAVDAQHAVDAELFAVGRKLGARTQGLGIAKLENEIKEWKDRAGKYSSELNEFKSKQASNAQMLRKYKDRQQSVSIARTPP